MRTSCSIYVEITIITSFLVDRRLSIAMEQPNAKIELKHNNVGTEQPCLASVTPRRSERLANLERKFYEQHENNVEATAGAAPISSTLTTINEDCLRHIVQYLNIVDVVNLAETCLWLQNFAGAVIYPRKARGICVKFKNMSRKIVLLTSLDKTFSSTLDRKRCDNAFGHFGKFVEDLTCIWYDSRDYQICKNMIARCQNLIKLRIELTKFQA